MGVLSDLVVADESDAGKVGRAPVPSREFGGIDIKGIDSIKFGTLHSLLTGATFRELLPLYDPVVTVSEEGPWVFRIPQDLVERLVGLGAAERRSTAEQWAATEEFRLDGWKPQEVADALEAICGEASKAMSSGRALFLWMSL
jgi:hypothetical protein